MQTTIYLNNNIKFFKDNKYMLRIITFDNKKHDYFEFSSFYEAPIKYKKNIYLSAEHYYQSEKYNYNNELAQYYRKLIIVADSSKKASLLGRQKKFIYDWPVNKKYPELGTVKENVDKYKNTVKKVDNWDKIKYKIMYKITKEKFKQYPKLKKLLLSTGNKSIVENTTGIWGMKNNQLGNILMTLRDKFNKK